MQKITLAMNLPWSLVGLFYGLFALPRSIKTDKLTLVIVVKVRRLWVNEIFLGRRVRGFTLGNTVLLSNVADDNTYDHEIVHVRQFTKAPFVFPILYCLEFIKNGYQDNKYEKEARQSSFVEINPARRSGVNNSFFL